MSKINNYEGKIDIIFFMIQNLCSLHYKIYNYKNVFESIYNLLQFGCVYVPFLFNMLKWNLEVCFPTRFDGKIEFSWNY